MSMADHAFGRLGLGDLVTEEDLRIAGAIGGAVLAGCVIAKAMALSILSLPGLGMIAAAVIVGQILANALRMHKEQRRLEEEHFRQIELADSLMLTPASIK